MKFSTACCRRSGRIGEAGEIADEADDGGDVLLRHADPVGAADDEVEAIREGLQVAGVDLVVAAEQAVAVDDRPRRMGDAAGDGEARDVDQERRLGGAVLHAAGRWRRG